MFAKRINTRMLRMKLHYFLYLGGITSVVGFAPTIAKQLGYSAMMVGYLYTYLSIISLLIKLVSGLIADKFPVLRFMFLASILSSGLSAFAFIFAEKLPTDFAVDLNCSNRITLLDFCSNFDDRSSQCDGQLFNLLKNNTHLKCQMFCQQNQLFWSEICESWGFSDYCTPLNGTFKDNDLGNLNVSLFINITDQNFKKENFNIFQIESVKTKKNEVFFPVCQQPVTTRCDINCPNDVIMELANVSNFKGNVLSLQQFWEFCIVISLLWISQAITWSLQDPICFNLLGDKPEDFGKQRCWGSISWGIFSILGGALVDYFSENDFQKNYTPIYYLCLLIIVCDFVLARKIKVTETTGSKNMFSDVFKLFTKLNVIIYFMWIIMMGICTSMIWNYLFWYMEDITSTNQPDKRPWIKTLQGLAIGIQCIGGEMPFLFFSGHIIKRIGHWHCMTLGLFAFAVRFHLYSIITDPVWILPVELVNGITFGLSHSVLMAYAKSIAPVSAVTTVLSFSGSLFEGVGVSLGGVIGGFLYETYGGAQTYRLFSYGSLTMCILHALFFKFNKKHI